MPKKSPFPKCISCGRKATRWDGGSLGHVVDSKQNPIRMRPGYIEWLCTKCDPHHKYFDLPDTLPDAIAEIVCLREKLQELFVQTYDAVVRDREERRKQGD